MLLSEAMIAGPVAIAGIPMNIKTIRVLKTEKSMILRKCGGAGWTGCVPSG